MTTGLYLLRCLQHGFRLEDLDYIRPGLVFDVFTESTNDNYKDEYKQIATQADFDAFRNS